MSTQPLPHPLLLQGLTLTLSDLEALHNNLETEAAAQREGNWGDEDSCTYTKGHIYQPVYACITCSGQDPTKRAGFCLGCSMHCHLEHDVVELFHRRDFKCDCGTPKAGNTPCQLAAPIEDRSTNNDLNSYNHNFDGVYCWCNKPYDEDTIMIQCCVCEDWYHDTCIVQHMQEASNQPNSASSSSSSPHLPEDIDPKYGFTCEDCVRKHSFLRQYPELTVFGTHPAGPSGDQDSAPVINVPEGECRILGRDTPSSLSSLCWAPGWRSQLCVCTQCMEMYNRDRVAFILNTEVGDGDEDEEDEGGDEDGQDAPAPLPAHSGPSMLETVEQNLMKKLPAVQQIEIAHAFQDMKSVLTEHLRKIKAEGREVTEGDIHSAFEELQRKKRKK